MAMWIDPPEEYEFWTWLNEEGDGPDTEWVEREGALEDLKETASQTPDTARWIVHGRYSGSDYEEISEELFES